MSEKLFHTLSNGQEVWIKMFTGVVLSSEKSETVTVHEGMRLPDAKGNLQPGAIYSKTHNHHVVWLRADDGTEREVNIGDIGLPLREGHQVTVAGGHRSGEAAGPYFAARNHSTGEERCDLYKAVGSSIGEWKLKTGLGWHICGWALGCSILAFLATFVSYSGRDKLSPALILGFLAFFPGLVVGGFAANFSGGMAKAEALMAEINRFTSDAMKAELSPTAKAKADVITAN